MAIGIRRSAYEVLQVREDADDVVIQAAYRALAAVHHPDSNPSGDAQQLMAELNAAYDALRTPERRDAYDRLHGPATPPPPVIWDAPSPSSAAKDASVLDFGRYEGWSLTDLARHDPDYLRWLGRHSSGIRYRRKIDELLRARDRAGSSRGFSR